MIKNKRMNGSDWLIIEGLIGSDEQFSLLSSRSQQRVTVHKPKGAEKSSEYSLILLNDEGDTLIRDHPTIETPVVCHEYEPDHKVLTGRLPLLPDAAVVVILRQEREIYRCKVGKKPDIKVKWPKVKWQRGKSYHLKLALSKPKKGDDTLLILAIHWGSGNYRVVAISEASENLTFDPKDLPGGKACHLSVTYRVGFHSMTVVSPSFSLAPLKPHLRMLKPREETTLVAGAPVALVAEVDDPQGDRSLPAALRWTVDGKCMGKSPQALLSGLPEGEHNLVLSIEGMKLPVIKRTLKVHQAPKI
ncbi:MAG: hypothetical protein KZQ89_10190 [Candidatus Thiodiazotropha sp. (ex Lucinoma kastoroae)]|nr:hypothetical protein [Candidatus Thiodiazotropha sp. (ex Lucinoma kastoroae)]MCU7860781.1 hypothetical protein [Candidatus Thiodiazotropha sp. (ex Lucinoma kastoroae)]